ncbi:MAG: D-alanine--D-alanine ligase, partial [Candidatus Eisenbacteria bacterium]|nr:D-alanine--D-alanine ligase [Candidatus Eisenbacteria bacterium]
MRIAVLMGGTSTERDVSLVTAHAVGAALTGRGHRVLLVDTAKGGEAVEPSGDGPSVSTTPPESLREEGAALLAVAGSAVREADVVFVALHGGTGEDGTIQGLLELAGKRYTGSGVRASALAMDKHVSKLLFRDAGVATPDWRVVSSQDGPFKPDEPGADRARRALADLGGCPVVVKPNDQGSTVGLTIVRDPDDYLSAVALAGSFSDRVLVEPYVEGREMTVAVLGDEALPVVEIAPESGFYDYES